MNSSYFIVVEVRVGLDYLRVGPRRGLNVQALQFQNGMIPILGLHKFGFI
jgi:hypothetical protein